MSFRASRTFRAARPGLLLALLAALALGACENQPMPGVNPTPAAAPAVAPPPPGVGTSTSADVVSTTTVSTTTDAAGEPVVEVETEVDENAQPASARTPEQREGDIEGCYNYAWSQVQHDVQVQDDSSTVVDSTVNPGFTAFTQKLDNYGNEKRRGELFDNCMRAKGYTEGY
jgi:hypothetical protein